METIKAIYLFFQHIDLQLAFDNVKAITLSVLTLIGMGTIFFTILGQVCKQLQELTDNVEIDGFLGKVIIGCNKASTFGIRTLHIFPTWGTNPATKALKDRIEELEGSINSEKANDNQGKTDA